MTRIVQTTVYKFDELPTDDAKARARDWWREASAGDNWFSESALDDLVTVGNACGLQFGGRNPNNSTDDGIYWSGFSSQGDGASFNATWHANGTDVEKIAAIIADRPISYTVPGGAVQHCESNAELVPVLEAFQDLAIAAPEAYGTASASNRGHSMSMDYNIGDCPACGCVDNGECQCEPQPVRDEAGNADTFSEACTDLARWFYRSLEREYEYANSDEIVDENIRANEYEFTELGRIV